MDGLSSEDGCLDVCLANLGRFHAQTLQASRIACLLCGPFARMTCQYHARSELYALAVWQPSS